MKVAIIGAGAAGYFAAISCKQQYPEADVVIYEKTDKVLAKVKVSGGGRCNVTNACESLSEFLSHYPRGKKQLKKTLHQFNRLHTIEWFAGHGVDIVAEADGRMFPSTNDSQTIIDCLEDETKKLDVKIKRKQAISQIELLEEGNFLLTSLLGAVEADHLIVTTGGSSKNRAYDWLREMGHDIVPPVPSLFTFNMTGEQELKALMGLAVANAEVKIRGTKLAQSGPLLVTHWGLSGPAVLKLSAWGARQLAEMAYGFEISVNWCGVANEEAIRTMLESGAVAHAKKKIINANLFGVPSRLWIYLLNRLSIDDQLLWYEVKKKDKNRLVNVLYNDSYAVQGKTTFKEEFVTCGGVALADVDFNTMQSRKVPNLYFAGEVLDIDGVTGGFNFQAAWSTGYIAGLLQGLQP